MPPLPKYYAVEVHEHWLVSSRVFTKWSCLHVMILEVIPNSRNLRVSYPRTYSWASVMYMSRRTRGSIKGIARHTAQLLDDH